MSLSASAERPNVPADSSDSACYRAQKTTRARTYCRLSGNGKTLHMERACDLAPAAPRCPKLWAAGRRGRRVAQQGFRVLVDWCFRAAAGEPCPSVWYGETEIDV